MQKVSTRRLVGDQLRMVPWLTPRCVRSIWLICPSKLRFDQQDWIYLQHGDFHQHEDLFLEYSGVPRVTLVNWPWDSTFSDKTSSQDPLNLLQIWSSQSQCCGMINLRHSYPKIGEFTIDAHCLIMSFLGLPTTLWPALIKMLSGLMSAWIIPHLLWRRCPNSTWSTKVSPEAVTASWKPLEHPEV